ncbi:hypothetical protein WJX75_003930 [Coccomyxa subellipsoidea]|uniref:Non-structural maintenance of chromosomes element 1 homolog n=1 Tax=Coccomyxa subellipsoidea TaxID=248742 RepID=A0ABR2YDV9_9CHLO
MLEDDAKELYKNLMQSKNDTGYLNLVGEIDKEISFCNFRLGRLIFPLDSKWYIAVINKMPDEVAKTLGSSFTLAQVHFLKTVLEAIAMDADAEDGIGSVGAVQTSNLNFSQTQTFQATQGTGGSQAASQQLKLSMVEKEALLPRLVEEHWLAPNPDRMGYYSIGVRSFLELKDYLLSLELPDETRAAWERFL